MYTILILFIYSGTVDQMKLQFQENDVKDGWRT